MQHQKRDNFYFHVTNAGEDAIKPTINKPKGKKQKSFKDLLQPLIIPLETNFCYIKLHTTCGRDF